MGGSSQSTISGDKSENNHGVLDFWVVKINAAGSIQWQNTIGGNYMDALYSFEQTTDGKYILGGLSLSDISGDKSENCMGSDDFWIVKITDDYNSITGKLFVDTNNNGFQDSGEPSVINKLVSENYTGSFTFTEQNGKFSVFVLDSGTFSVSPATLNYYNIVPTSHDASFTGIQQTDSLNDFAYQPAGVFNDLCVTITPLSPFRAGFNGSYLITYENVGTTTLNPTVIFFADDDVSFVSAIPAANTATLDSVVWNFGPLSPFQQGSILVTVNVAIGTPIGTVISSGAHIEPLTGDANTICNQSYWEVLTTGSADPNDIIVNEDTLLTTQFPNPPFLEYIIRFQNTGNDTAFTVNILNPIDTSMLELNTIEFIAASHPVNLSWISWEKNMQFHFENILLPDSNVNETASHGFVRYRIKPKSSLILGDSISNNAAIYFDFNAPVITNTAITRVVLPTSIHETNSYNDNLLLYPNPANSKLTIETGALSSSDCRLIISDVAGRILFSESITTALTKHDIDISSLSQGIYFVQIQNGERISRSRFVKE